MYDAQENWNLTADLTSEMYKDYFRHGRYPNVDNLISATEMKRTSHVAPYF